MELRGYKEIQTVAELAVRNVNMPRNVAKSSWKHTARRRLFLMLLIEVWELFKALWAYFWARDDYQQLFADFYDLPEYVRALEEAKDKMLKARDAVKHEAGDCVAFLAFIVDRL